MKKEIATAIMLIYILFTHALIILFAAHIINAVLRG